MSKEINVEIREDGKGETLHFNSLVSWPISGRKLGRIHALKQEKNPPMHNHLLSPTGTCLIWKDDLKITAVIHTETFPNKQHTE